MFVFSNLSSSVGIGAHPSDEDIVRAVAAGVRPAVLLGWMRHRDRGSVAASLAAAMRDAVARDALAANWLRSAIGTLTDAGIPSIVLKGAAISQLCYPEPWLRPRNDDDVLVPAADFAAAQRALMGAGYMQAPQNPGPDILGQAHFHLPLGNGDVHAIDLHARPLVPAAFDGLPGFDAIAATAWPLPAIGPGVRGPSASHALLLGCAHRVAHHTPTEDPTWLVDQHLLAERLTEQEWAAFANAAESARVAEVCAAELQRGIDTYGTRVPPAVMSRLSAIRGEESARYLLALGPLYSNWLQLRHSSGLRARAEMVVDHVLPSRAYMEAKFGAGPAYRLPWLYARRVVLGFGRWAHEFAQRRRQA